MGEILPFVARVRASGDWTASERARLEDLADQFTAAGGRVEVVFGTTEEGDPWCVVKDDQEEVLVHVARIGGKFVVHYAVEDALEEGVDLHTALSDRLVAEDAHDDVVVPFSVAGRQAQTFIALIVAAAFFYETQDIAVAAEPETPLQLHEAVDEADSLPAGDDPSLRHEREVAANGSVFADPAPTAPTHAAWTPVQEPTAAAGLTAPDLVGSPVAAAEPAPAEAPQDSAAPVLATVEARTELAGTDGDDLLVGGGGADLIRGGAGADTLQGGGAGHGQVDVLDGGAGDDRIELTGQVVATGGEGADTFVIQAPVAMGQASTLLGVLTDFSAAEGDRLMNSRGESVVVTTLPAPPSSQDGPQQTEMLPTLTPPSPPATMMPGRQVQVDLDGDGQIDGYILLARMQAVTIYELPHADGPRMDPVFLPTGGASDYTDPF